MLIEMYLQRCKDLYNKVIKKITEKINQTLGFFFEQVSSFTWIDIKTNHC